MKLILVLIVSLFAHQLSAQWTHISSPTVNNLKSVHFANSTVGYAAGDNNTLLKTVNSGVSWTVLSTGFTGHFSSVHCLNKDTVFVSVNPTTSYSAPAQLIKTSDGGNTWSASSPFSSLNSSINDVCAISPDLVFCIGAVWARNYNMGNSYMEVGAGSRLDNDGSTWQISGVFGSASNLQWRNPLHSVCFVDTLTGYNSGDAAINKTLDGGRTWANLNNYNGNSIFFTDQNTGYVAGDNGIIRKTTNGGASWTSQNTGLTTKLTSIHFTSADTGCAVGIWGTVVGTTNGGTTWISEHSGWTIYDLHSVFFTDADNGYAVGDNGTILKTTLGPVGFKEINAGAEAFALFPNPAKDNIGVRSAWTNGDVLLYDLTGCLLKKMPFSSGNFTIGLSELSAGIYFIKLANEGRSIVQKFVVE